MNREDREQIGIFEEYLSRMEGRAIDLRPDKGSTLADEVLGEESDPASSAERAA